MDSYSITHLLQSEQDNTPLLIQQINKFTFSFTEQDQLQQYLYSSIINSNIQLDRQLQFLISMCAQIKRSLQVIKKNSQDNETEKAGQQGQKIKQIPELVIKQIKNIFRTKEKDISNVANKLKVFVSKVLQKQSSKLKYNYSCFISQALEELNQFDFNQTLERIREEFTQIRSKFNVVNSFVVKMHRFHYTTFFISNSFADAFVSFYIEKLLFLLQSPLPFNGNILFVPIIFIKQKNRQTGKAIHVDINGWYLNQLIKQNSNWQNFCLQIMIKNPFSSTIDYYFCANFQKRGPSENETCSNLRKIRCFVYFSLLFNYLKHALTQHDQSQNKKQIRIKLNQNQNLIISTQKHTVAKKTETNPKIFSAIMKYFDEQSIRKRAQLNKLQIGLNFINYMLCTLSKLTHNIQIPQQYINMKPKYIYVGNKRVQI